MDRNLRRNTVILVCSLTAVLIAYLVCFLLPQRRRAEQLRSEIQQKQTEIEQFRKRATQLTTLNNDLAQLDMVNQRAAEQIPPALNVREFLATAHSLGQQAGVTISNVTPGIVTELVGVQQQPINLALVGKFRPVMQLIYQLETMSRLIELSDLDLRCIEKDGSTADLLEVKLTVRLFARPPKPTAPAQNNG